jgi:hypothetical protein
MQCASENKSTFIGCVQFSEVIQTYASRRDVKFDTSIKSAIAKQCSMPSKYSNGNDLSDLTDEEAADADFLLPDI